MLLFTLYGLLHAGYMNDDCSVRQGQVPQITELAPPICNVRNQTADGTPCRKVQLYVTGASFNNLACRIRVSMPTIFVQSTQTTDILE